MIYFLADTHGDISRLSRKALRRLRKGDFLIICGDFGFVWDNTRTEKRQLARLGRRRYHILFAEGAHENYHLLLSRPPADFCGGKARQISKNLWHLPRGEVFTLGDKTVFVFGGGSDENPDHAGDDPQALPSREEFSHAMDVLNEHNNSVNYIVSYEAPSKIAEFVELANARNRSVIHRHLDIISETCRFDRWFFGGYHINRVVTSKYTAVFDKLISENNKIGGK